MRWIGIVPAADTAFALGDTLQLASTMTDAHGERLSGVAAGWRSTDSAVASVDSSGSVTARAAGTATIVLAAGDRIAQARVVVSPRPAAVRLVGGDSIVRLPEGAERRLVAQVVDARGHAIAGERVTWRAQDPAVAAVDSVAVVRGLAAGRTLLTATGADRSVETTVEVFAVAGSITLLSGDGQRAPAGQRLALPVRAQVVSRSGRPMAAVPVHFLAGDASGTGRAQPEYDTTDAAGVARTEWTLGAAPGRQRLAIGADGLPGATFAAAEADPVPANTRAVALDSGLAAPAGDTLARTVGIRITDSLGLPLGDVPVAWTADGGGAIEPQGARSDSLGEARARWRLGPRAGVQRASVQIGGPRALPRVTLVASALAGPPASVVALGPHPGGGVAGEPLRPGPAFRVVDRLGNPVAGVAVALRASAGALRDTAPATDASGRATAAWTLGPAAGEQRLTASVASLDSARALVVRARSGPPAALVFTGVPAAAPAGRPLAAPVRLEVRDAHGNPVPGAVVRLAVGGGTVSPAGATADERGQVSLRWTLGPKAGPQSLTAALGSGALRARATTRATPAVRSRRAP